MLNEKVAIITGGTRGIGFETARTFLQNGASVAILGSKEESVNNALENLKKENRDYNVIGFHPNLVKENEVKEIFNQAVNDAKIDSDFENLDVRKENSSDLKNNDGEWIYTESDDSFELWRNGEYNSNNYSIKIKKYELDIEKEMSDDYEL